MSKTGSSEGYVATKTEWAQRVSATRNPDWLVAVDNADCPFRLQPET